MSALRGKELQQLCRGAVGMPLLQKGYFGNKNGTSLLTQNPLYYMIKEKTKNQKWKGRVQDEL
jgi:hypothetical protein